jgi:hypothetical protein
MVNSLDLRDKPQDLSGGQKSAITLVMAMAPDIPIPEFRSPEIHIPASGNPCRNVACQTHRKKFPLPCHNWGICRQKTSDISSVRIPGNVGAWS